MEPIKATKVTGPSNTCVQMRVFGRIEGVSRVDSVRNEDIRLRLGHEGILDVVRRRQ